MPICPQCHTQCKTAQGLAGHMRFRHQMTVPKQDLPVYAKDRLDKAEDENTKLHEQVARLQRQRQDQESFYEKRLAEQRTELEKTWERKLAEQQKLTGLKQPQEQTRSERARAEEEAIRALLKQAKDLGECISELNSQNKKTYDLGKSLPETGGRGTNTGEATELISELEKARQDLRRERERDRSQSPSFLPPLPHPPGPLSSLRELGRWLFDEDGSE